MDRYLESCCDGIDATVFSGDSLYDEDTRKVFKEFCERWLRRVKEVEDEEGVA